MVTYNVYSLDVWGHSSSECGEYDCPCVEEGKHDDSRCMCGFDVNDRCKIGTVEIAEGETDDSIVETLYQANYLSLHGREVAEVDAGISDDECIYIRSKEDGRPFFELDIA